MTDHITRLKEALEGVSDGAYVLQGCDVRMFRELLERLEQAEKDASRYRFLRDDLDSGWAICEWCDDHDCIGYYRDGRAPGVVDAAIDAAIASQAAPPADGGGQNGGKAASSAAKCLSGNDSSVVDGGGQDG